MAYKKKTRNLQDLAEKAGVTAATASMALRNSPRLSTAVKAKICRLADEEGFVPRAYTRKSPVSRKKRFSHLGTVHFIDNSIDEADPVGVALLSVLGPMMNQYGVDFQVVNQQKIAENPEILNNIEAVFFYNDPKVMELIPENIPAVQVFGWKKQRKNCDRITANDAQIVEIAVDYLKHAEVERSAIFWREDMINTFPHPRIKLFLEQMNALGIETTEFHFGKFDTDFTERLKQYIESGSDRIGFFGFNARCGVKLCCGLDSLGLLQKYCPKSVIICDNNIMLKDFWPNPVMIDLGLPLIAQRALEMLIVRLEHPGIPEAFVLQSPWQPV